MLAVGTSVKVLPPMAAVKPKRAMIGCKAQDKTSVVPAAVDATPSTPPTPEWMPEQIKPALGFLNSTEFKVNDWGFYDKYIREFVEGEAFAMSTGWKELPETINGRAAMLGFLAGAAAELFGAGSLLQQMACAPQPVLVAVAVITTASIIPVAKEHLATLAGGKQGTDGDYMASLKDVHLLPEGVFTETNEKVHGRLAMLGLACLLAIELVKGSALL